MRRKFLQAHCRSYCKLLKSIEALVQSYLAAAIFSWKESEIVLSNGACNVSLPEVSCLLVVMAPPTSLEIFQVFWRVLEGSAIDVASDGMHLRCRRRLCHSHLIDSESSLSVRGPHFFFDSVNQLNPNFSLEDERTLWASAASKQYISLRFLS